MVLKISQKGWVVIPADLRRKYDLKPGDEIHVVDYGGVLSLIPASKDPVKQGLGILKGEKSLTDALIAERKRERERER
ncbi:MAG: AbrB/MazE/SpoVT family DNA-binding domain-containing protein [Anaerolineales bacterium]|nr:AbrB/MazE/SpoVT family DNA-binding domain-containing protein [Anaerolineales bacterium]